MRLTEARRAVELVRRVTDARQRVEQARLGVGMVNVERRRRQHALRELVHRRVREHLIVGLARVDAPAPHRRLAQRYEHRLVARVVALGERALEPRDHAPAGARAAQHAEGDRLLLRVGGPARLARVQAAVAQGSRLQLAAVGFGCPRDQRRDEERLAGVGALLDVREREEEGLLEPARRVLHPEVPLEVAAAIHVSCDPSYLCRPRCHVPVLEAHVWIHSNPLRKRLGARAELFVLLRIGQRHPGTLVRGVIGVSHLGRGVVVLEEGHEYRRRVVVEDA